MPPRSHEAAKTRRSPSSRQRPELSRREALALAATMLGGAALPSNAQDGPGLMLPVGDMARLVRRLLAARRDGLRASKRARLTDPSTGRKATLLIADDGGNTLAMLLSFVVAGEPLHVHTVSMTLDDGESLYLELFRAPPEGRKNEEVVGAQLDPVDLERLAGSSTVTVIARGWDETFTATLEGKELEKIRRFHEKRKAAADRAPEGSASDPDGSASDPDGSASDPDGSASDPVGSA